MELWLYPRDMSLNEVIMKKLLIFIDLDVTLIDHQSYEWGTAKPVPNYPCNPINLFG